MKLKLKSFSFIGLLIMAALLIVIAGGCGGSSSHRRSKSGGDIANQVYNINANDILDMDIDNNGLPDFLDFEGVPQLHFANAKSEAITAKTTRA